MKEPSLSTTQVVVGRIGKPHGIRGELSVEGRACSGIGGRTHAPDDAH